MDKEGEEIDNVSLISLFLLIIYVFGIHKEKEVSLSIPRDLAN